MKLLKDHKIGSDDILFISFFSGVTGVLLSLFDMCLDIQLLAPIGVTFVVMCALFEIFVGE